MIRTIEVRKPRSLLGLAFRFVGWLASYALVDMLTFDGFATHPNIAVSVGVVFAAAMALRPVRYRAVIHEGIA